MFAGIKAPNINRIIGFPNYCFVFYVIDRKQYTSINGFNSSLTNIYGIRKGLVSGCHLLLTHISGLYGR